MEDDQTDPEMVLLVLMERAFKGPTHEGVRILDWATQLKRVLKCVRENDPMTMELRGEIDRLRAELEASETELRIVRASQAESNAEVERLRAELDSMTASRKAAAAWGELWRAYQARKQAVIDAGMASNPMRAVAANMCPFCHSMIGAPHELWCRHSALAAKGE